MSLSKTCLGIDTTDRVRSYIRESFLFGEDDERFTDDASFLETGIIDSTGILELVSFIERQFDLSVYDGEMVPENLDSVSAITGFVARKHNGHGEA